MKAYLKLVEGEYEYEVELELPCRLEVNKLRTNRGKYGKLEALLSHDGAKIYEDYEHGFPSNRRPWPEKPMTATAVIEQAEEWKQFAPEPRDIEEEINEYMKGFENGVQTEETESDGQECTTDQKGREGDQG